MSVAIVVGGASGIGAATSAALQGSNWTVAIIDKAPGPWFVADAGNQRELRAAIDRATAHHGPPTAWVHTVGTPCPGRIESITSARFRQCLGLNLVTAFHVIQEALARATRPTSIVVIASGAGLLPRASDPAYGAAKAAVLALVNSVGVAAAGDGHLVTAVCPGPVDTPMLRAAAPDQAAVDHLASMVAIGRILSPREVADFIAWIVDTRPMGLAGAAVPFDAGKSSALIDYRGGYRE